MSFKLDITGRHVVEDDGSANPIIWTIPEARGRMARLETQAATYEREADVATRNGRDIDADVARAMASINLTLATDLLLVLQGVDAREAA